MKIEEQSSRRPDWRGVEEGVENTESRACSPTDPLRLDESMRPDPEDRRRLGAISGIVLLSGGEILTLKKETGGTGGQMETEGRGRVGEEPLRLSPSDDPLTLL